MTETRRVFEILAKDRSALARLSKDKAFSADFYYRTATRQAFADLESRLFQFHQILLAFNALESCQVSREEEILLSEKNYRINDKGEVETRTQYARVADNLLFVFKILCRIDARISPIDKSGPEWKDFKTATQIRDRLTHPRLAECLNIDQEKFEVVFATAKWLDSIFLNALSVVNEVFANEVYQGDGINSA
jgi:hypothetical protein